MLCLLVVKTGPFCLRHIQFNARGWDFNTSGCGVFIQLLQECAEEWTRTVWNGPSWWITGNYKHPIPRNLLLHFFFSPSSLQMIPSNTSSSEVRPGRCVSRCRLRPFGSSLQWLLRSNPESDRAIFLRSIQCLAKLQNRPLGVRIVSLRFSANWTSLCQILFSHIRKTELS